MESPSAEGMVIPSSHGHARPAMPRPMIAALDCGLIMCATAASRPPIRRTHVHNDDDAGFPKLGAPARRALSAAGYTRVNQLAQVSEPDLKKLHGMGPTAIAALRDALHERGLSFHPGVPASGHLAGSGDEIDEYLRGVEEPGRSTLQTLRRTILEIVPDAEEVISYRVPAFRVGAETVAGFAAFKNHLSYLPFSGSVLSQVADELKGYAMTKSSLHFPVDHPLPKALVKKLIKARLAQVGRRTR
jgi:uncharacterized protein YdhG (YjbR/CyaY superfamily)